MNRPISPEEDDLQPEYDFSQGVRGKHYKAYRRNNNVVFSDAQLAKVKEYGDVMSSVPTSDWGIDE